MAFRAAVEVDLDCDVPALMDVYMVMPAQLKDFDGQQNVNWGVLVDTVLDLIWLGQRLLALGIQIGDVSQHRLDWCATRFLRVLANPVARICRTYQTKRSNVVDTAIHQDQLHTGTSAFRHTRYLL